MKTRSENNSRRRRGSALILVIVVTVLLAVIGVMFVMVSRLEGVLSVSVTQDRELDEAVNMVTARIEQLLMEDLFDPSNPNTTLVDDGGFNEPYDWTGRRNFQDTDAWLASIEPVWVDENGTPDPAGEFFQWQFISNITDYPPIVFLNESHGGTGCQWDRKLRDTADPGDLFQYEATVPEYQDPTEVGRFLPADADGDGVLDSVWIQLDGSTCRGREVYAAVRIIDNGGLLNLNTASVDMASVPNGWQSAAYYKDAGKYLSELNYSSFLRGADADYPSCLWRARNWAKQPWLTFEGLEAYHNNAIMHLGDADYLFTDHEPFGLQDELEIRNRFLLTSLAQARFESQTQPTSLPPRYGLYETFDLGRGEFSGGWNTHIRSRRLPYTADDFDLWQARLDPNNFDYQTDNDPQTDRRHLCTFYSFDRQLPPAVNKGFRHTPEQFRDAYLPEDGRQIDLRNLLIEDSQEARRQVFHLLFALRSYFMPPVDVLDGMDDVQWNAERQIAARKACQFAANLIDYLDDPNQLEAHPLHYDGNSPLSQTSEGPTYINFEVVRSLVQEFTENYYGNPPVGILEWQYGLGIGVNDVFYGYEKQPFISELYSVVDGRGILGVAVELMNPYDTPLDVSGWRISLPPTGEAHLIPDNTVIPAAVIDNTDPAGSTFGHLVIHTPENPVIRMFPDLPASAEVTTFAGFGLLLGTAQSVELQRPDPANPTDPNAFLTVDLVRQADIGSLLGTPTGINPRAFHSIQRDIKAWKFANVGSFESFTLTGWMDTTSSLGSTNNYNNVNSNEAGYQLPVADGGRLERWADFQKVIRIGNQASSDPNAITTVIAKIASQGDESDLRFRFSTDPDLMRYLCFMQRPDGRLPGRININTASRHVIAAAIPPGMANSLPGEIVAHRQTQPIRSLVDLVTNPTAFPSVAAFLGTGAGDPMITNDFEERDWVINRLANIFTVRSDVFTAYILVRVGRDGPQRRMMAIYDRSRVWTPEDRPQMILHPVADPR